MVSTIERPQGSNRVESPATIEAAATEASSGAFNRACRRRV
jgi:hypothetical protein